MFIQPIQELSSHPPPRAGLAPGGARRVLMIGTPDHGGRPVLVRSPSSNDASFQPDASREPNRTLRTARDPRLEVRQR